MLLTPDEERLLAGAAGEGTRFAMSIVVEYGTAIGAQRLLRITRAHVDSCLYQGESGQDFVERLLRGGTRVGVPTTLNVGAVDLMHPGLNRGDAESVQAGRNLMDAYRRLGCRPTWTCAPYQLADRPAFGEHVAWAESNAIAFINSVVGARTDRYGDLIDICAAITGRVPDHGLQRSENRRGEVVFDLAELDPAWFSEELLWPLLGIVVGRLSSNRVPVIAGVSGTPTEDSLKAFGAAAASAGSVALFHLVGVTPEAPTLEAALHNLPPRDVVRVDKPMLREAAEQLSGSRDGELVAVTVGTPHFSRSEFEALIRLIDGRRRSASVDFYVNAGRGTLNDLERDGMLQPLLDFGVEVVTDTCTYLKPIMRRSEGLVMTNSAKWAYYAPGNLGYEVLLAGLSDCVESAVAGRPVLTSHPFHD